MRARDIAAMSALWVGLPALALALLASEALPSPQLSPESAPAAVAGAQAVFALFAWPAFVRRIVAPERSAADAAVELGWRIAALAALGTPLAWAGATLGRAGGDGVAGAFGLVLLWLIGGSCVGLATRPRSGIALRGYVALGLAATAGLPLVGYLCAELRGQAATGAALALGSPLVAVVAPGAGPGRAACALAYLAAAIAWVVAVRIFARTGARPAGAAGARVAVPEAPALGKPAGAEDPGSGAGGMP